MYLTDIWGQDVSWRRPSRIWWRDDWFAWDSQGHVMNGTWTSAFRRQTESIWKQTGRPPSGGHASWWSENPNPCGWPIGSLTAYADDTWVETILIVYLVCSFTTGSRDTERWWSRSPDAMEEALRPWWTWSMAKPTLLVADDGVPENEDWWTRMPANDVIREAWYYRRTTTQSYEWMEKGKGVLRRMRFWFIRNLFDC